MQKNTIRAEESHIEAAIEETQVKLNTTERAEIWTVVLKESEAAEIGGHRCLHR
jgi:hypothetical protein